MLFNTVHRRAAACLAAAAWLAACAPVAVRPPAAIAPPAIAADFQETYYRNAKAADEKVLAIAPQASLITITVRRGGALGRLGHDHLVACRAIAGFVAPGRNRTDFHFRLDQLSVDEGALRSEAGFDTQLSPEAIAGTRRNMLNKVLDAERFPDVLVHASRGPDDNLLEASITLHGVTRAMQIPGRIEEDAAGRMTVSGKFSLKQSDFGIVPFAVMGGALAVQDQLDLQFRIVASRL